MMSSAFSGVRAMCKRNSIIAENGSKQYSFYTANIINIMTPVQLLIHEKLRRKRDFYRRRNDRRAFRSSQRAHEPGRSFRIEPFAGPRSDSTTKMAYLA